MGIASSAKSGNIASQSNPTASLTQTAPTPYHFQAETVWAKLSIGIYDFHGHFRLECQSDNPIEGWVLSDKKNNKTISSNDNGPGTSFELEISQPFDACELTVFVHGDNQQIPMLVALAPAGESIWITPTPTLYEPFQTDPNRPYNTLVKSLYEQAGQTYGRGDVKSAVELLEKAEKIDPAEPQVQALMNKIFPRSAEKPTKKLADSIDALLIQAQKTEEGKKRTEARKWYLAVLKLDPKNRPAREGIERLRTDALEQSAKKFENSLNAGDVEAAKMILSKIIEAFPKDARIPNWRERIARSRTDRKDTTAKADAAYNMGLESYRRDDFISAKKFWEEALQDDPQYLQAQQNLDRLHREHPEL